MIPINERKQIDLTFAEFDDDLKHDLITHEKTSFFLERFPLWQENEIKTDVLGQRLNGVLNVSYTIDINNPVWSPIDMEMHKQYMETPENGKLRNFLARQIVNMLYIIRCNLMHGRKGFDDRNDVTVVNNALPILKTIVFAFTNLQI